MKPVPGSLSLSLVSLIFFGSSAPQTQAQINADDGTNTVVTQTGNTFDIIGGTQAGSNLFHSFRQFGLNAGQVATFFANPTASTNPAIQNILGRIAGSSTSFINGQIRVAILDNRQILPSNANLYLMNPAGIVFGAGASLNVSGSFIATTANRIGFGDSWFNAVGDNSYPALMGSPNSYAFTSLQPGVIINAGNLAVGQSITLLGGTIVNTGSLSALNGTVTIASVPGERLVRISEVGNPLSLELLPPNTPKTAAALTLPQLLTGGDLSNATELTVKNGVVKLISSGIRVENGDVVARSLNSEGNIFISAANNITVETIQGRIIDITAGGLFRAIGVLNEITDEERPVSIYGLGSQTASLSKITIRYLGGTDQIQSSEKGFVQILGNKNVPFITGPDSTPPFVALFLPENTVGTVGSIYVKNFKIDEAGNVKLPVLVPDRIFSDNLPPRIFQSPSEFNQGGTGSLLLTNSTLDAQTVQRQLNGQIQAFSCYSASLGADNPTGDPCAQAIQDEQQILKILDESKDPGQSRELMEMKR